MTVSYELSQLLKEALGGGDGGMRAAFGTVLTVSGDYVTLRLDSMTTGSMGPIYVVTGKLKANDRALATYLPDNDAWVAWGSSVVTFFDCGDLSSLNPVDQSRSVYSTVAAQSYLYESFQPRANRGICFSDLHLKLAPTAASHPQSFYYMVFRAWDNDGYDLVNVGVEVNTYDFYGNPAGGGEVNLPGTFLIVPPGGTAAWESSLGSYGGEDGVAEWSWTGTEFDWQ